VVYFSCVLACLSLTSGCLLSGWRAPELEASDVPYLASPAADIYSAGLILLRILLPDHIELPGRTRHVPDLVDNAWYALSGPLSRHLLSWHSHLLSARLHRRSQICCGGCWSHVPRGESTLTKPCVCLPPWKQKRPPLWQHRRVLCPGRTRLPQRTWARAALLQMCTHGLAPLSRHLRRRYVWRILTMSLLPPWRCKPSCPHGAVSCEQ
jgi:hypothetical protein